MKTALFALLFTVSSFAYAADGAFGDINHADLSKALAAKAVTLIDVFATGRIPGAIDFESAGKMLVSKLPADKSALIVAYCGGPQCPAWQSAAKAVAALGYTNVKHYSGGISGWKEAGGKLEHN
jgi:rhodanese-related sulfurtransferase